MLKIDNETLIFTRGDSGEIAVTPLNDDETPYWLKESEYVRFFVRLLPGSEPVINKKLTAQNDSGELTVWLSPSDTDIPRASYIYEAKLYSGADESGIYTFIGGGTEKPCFIVT